MSKLIVRAIFWTGVTVMCLPFWGAWFSVGWAGFYCSISLWIRGGLFLANFLVALDIIAFYRTALAKMREADL